MLLCHRCHREIATSSAFRDVCPYCSTAIHSCLNCQYYDEFSPNKCSEDAADWVPDKQKANFCQFFEFVQPMVKRPMEVDKAKAYWESLGKKAL